MDGENKSKTVNTPTTKSYPIFFPPSQRPPPPISLSIRHPLRPPCRGSQVSRVVGVNAEEINEVDLFYDSAAIRCKKMNFLCMA